MNHYRWRMAAAGDYALTTWVGELQLTYRITHGDTGWVLTRRVAGARGVLEWDPAPTLQESMAIAEDDAQQVL